MFHPLQAFPPGAPARTARAADGVAGSWVAAAVSAEVGSTSTGRRSTMVERGEATTTSPGAKVSPLSEAQVPSSAVSMSTDHHVPYSFGGRMKSTSS